MKKQKLMALMLVAVMAAMTGCSSSSAPSSSASSGAGSSGAGSSSTASASQPQEKEPVTINFLTASTTGTVYPMGSAIANMWSEKLDYVTASAQASNGGVANLNYIQSGDAQMGVAVTSIAYESYKGEGTFEGHANEKLRVLAGLYYNPNQIVVTKDSGIETLTDIKGKKFAPGAPGGTPEVETKIHLTAAGLNYPDDFDAQFVGFTEAIDLMRNKQLDGAWIMAGVPTAAVTEITSTANGKLISLDDELIKKLQAEYPWYSEYIIPAGTYDGQDADIKTTAVKMTICTTADLPEDVVYDLTKAFWENIDTLAESQSILKSVKVEDAVTDLAGIPLHDGARKYYEEIGLTIEE